MAIETIKEMLVSWKIWRGLFSYNTVLRLKNNFVDHQTITKTYLVISPSQEIIFKK